MLSKNFSACLLLLLPFGLLAQTKTYSISGKAGDLNAPAKIYLTYRTEAGSKVDSSTLTNGNFLIKLENTKMTQANIILDHKGVGLRNLKKADYAAVYLDGNIHITTADSLSKAVIHGSQNTTDLQLLGKIGKPFGDRLNAIYIQAGNAPEEKKKQPGFEEELETKVKVVEDEQKLVMADFIRTHPNSIVSFDALRQFGGPFPEYGQVNPLFQLLAPELKETAQGKDYQKMLNKLEIVAIGAQAPEFSQNDSLGKPVSLSSFRGKYVLIDFWASWCGPCRKENPNLVATYQKFKGQNFTVLGVSLDSKRENWLKAVEKDNLDWAQVSDLKYWNNDVAQQYAVRAIPQNFLLDPQGKIVAKNLTGSKLSSTLEKILRNNTISGKGGE